jgi:hypothetical protein
VALGKPLPAASNKEEHLMHAVYLAARYRRHPEMRRVRDELVARGYVVTSRWIDQHDGALPDSLDHVALNS